jgi:predicted nucleic acid-binding protein
MIGPAIIGCVLYLDSNIFIYAVEKSHRWGRAAEHLLGLMEQGAISAVASDLVLAEVLTKPFADGDARHIDQYKRLLSSGGGLSMAKVSREVLTLAAQLRGEKSLKLYDAIHVATAQSAQCDYFLTQDERLGRALTDRPKWLQLSEIN